MIETLLESLTSFRAEAVFNPWAQNCSLSDTSSSFQIRLHNLRKVLSACVELENVDVWIGRDLGWRGGRRTGVPFIDELTIDDYSRSLRLDGLAKATIDAPMSERTATEIHLARRRVPRTVFFWNVFPYHPFEGENHRSNRMHTAREREVGFSMLLTVLAVLPFKNIITIGNDATAAIQRLGKKCMPVRHPSYGGQKDFHHQIDTHYGLTQRPQVQRDLFGE